MQHKKANRLGKRRPVLANRLEVADIGTMQQPRARLFSLLEILGITTHTTEHPAFFTVEEGLTYKAQLPGGHSKNLFTKDKKGQLYLISALSETQVNLNGLSKDVAAGRMSFGSPELMLNILGVTPGSVTPFALINDQEKQVRVILDRALWDHPKVYFHPLVNTASTAIAPDDLLTFLRHLGYAPNIRALQ